MCLCECLLVQHGEESVSDCQCKLEMFFRFPATMMVFLSGTPTWRVRTNLCNLVWYYFAEWLKNETSYCSEIGHVVFTLGNVSIGNECEYENKYNLYSFSKSCSTYLSKRKIRVPVWRKYYEVQKTPQILWQNINILTLSLSRSH